MLTRYSDVLAALRDLRLSADRISALTARLPEPVQERFRPLTQIFSDMMLMSDPPDHTRLRGLANRDPEQFLDPDRLDVTRQENRHVGLGFGIHFCLGSALARMEGQVTINTVLRRMPDIRLAGQELEWRYNPVFRGLKSLPVVF